jgi:hypothetical protein
MKHFGFQWLDEKTKGSGTTMKATVTIVELLHHHGLGSLQTACLRSTRSASVSLEKLHAQATPIVTGPLARAGFLPMQYDVEYGKEIIASEHEVDVNGIVRVTRTRFTFYPHRDRAASKPGSQ